jgi:hypothetical protein
MTDLALKRRPFLVGAGAGLVAAATPTAFAQGRRASGLSLPINGFVIADPLQTVIGTFTPVAAVAGPNGTLLLQGIFDRAGGGGRQNIALPLTLDFPDFLTSGVCTILDLQLGPLDLNLLGLEVHLNQINLVIEANPAGGLLGQLLCAIANLLQGGLQNVINQVVDLLNQILGLFR